ncbi:unnamed protein product, partial [Heterosigma akashiwo]
KGYIKTTVEVSYAGSSGVRRGPALVTVSKLFDFYKVDFGSSDLEILQWICKYTDGQMKEEINEILMDSSIEFK